MTEQEEQEEEEEDDDDDDDDDDLEARLSVYPDGSLVINKVHRKDSGLYKCRPGTGFALPSEAAAFLNVTCELFHTTLAVKLYSCNVPFAEGVGSYTPATGEWGLPPQ